MLAPGVSIMLLGAFALFSLRAASPTQPAPDTLIILQRGACEDRCAVYRIAIFADGAVLYDGQHFVRQPGLARRIIPAAVLNKLLDELDSGGFFDMANNYGYGDTSHCDSTDPGRPAAILSVSNRGRSKTILHSHRCVGAVPSRLTELEDKVDRAAGSAAWIR